MNWRYKKNPLKLGLAQGFSFLFFSHLGVALYYHFCAGINIEGGPAGRNWDWFWQHLPINLLRSSLLESLWHLHSQPPLPNFLMGLISKFYYPQHLQCLHLFHIVLGSIISGCYFLILLLTTQQPLPALLVALLLALDPALFLFEAYVLYDLQVLFWIVACASFLALYSQRRDNRFLILFVVAVNALVMTRSLMHIALVAAAVTVLPMLATKRKVRVFLMAMLVSMPTLGWHAKNYVQFGFFGTSSWFGLSAWKIVSSKVPDWKEQALAKSGYLDSLVVTNPAFTKPVAFRPYGYTEHSQVAALSKDDFNNVNVPLISKVYSQNALRLLKRHPKEYFHAVIISYAHFCRPTSDYKHFEMNGSSIQKHRTAYSTWLQQKWLGRLSEQLIGWNYIGSVYFFAIPAIVLVGVRRLLLTRKRRTEQGFEWVRQQLVLIFSLAMICFVTFTGSAFETYEGDRYKFYIESLIWMSAVMLLFPPLQSTRLKSAPG